MRRLNPIAPHRLARACKTPMRGGSAGVHVCVASECECECECECHCECGARHRIAVTLRGATCDDVMMCVVMHV